MNCNDNHKNTSKKIKHPEWCKPNCFILGSTGPAGLDGATGATGPTGPAGSVLNFADFYALMPPDNAATVAPGTDVSFP